MATPTVENADRFRWLFLANAVVVGLASAPLVIAYPAVFARLGIPTLENSFFVQLVGALFLVEAMVSALVWRRPVLQTDAVVAIVLMKGVFIALVVAATLGGTLPASGFLIAALIDALFSLAFIAMLRRYPARN